VKPEHFHLAGADTVHLTGIRQSGKTSLLVRAAIGAALMGEKVSYWCYSDEVRAHTYRLMYDLIREHHLPLERAIATPSSQTGFTFQSGGIIDLFLSSGYGSGHHRANFIDYDIGIGDEGVRPNHQAKHLWRAHEA
jgi:hypothetical protein